MSTKQEISQAVVVGCGQMGPGIAYTLATTGCKVKLYGRTSASVERGLQSFDRAVGALLDGGCISADLMKSVKALVTGSNELEEAAEGADLVIESIAENLGVKQELFGRLERICATGTIITSNTSGLPVGQLSEFMDSPGRFAVTHFWNPPHLMPLVEIVKGGQTSDQTMQQLVSLMREAGKTPVSVLKDTPGQLGNRLFHALIREAIYIVQEGIASVEDVDSTIKHGFGRRFPVYGALEHQDVAGLDTVFAIQSYLCRALCRDTEPSAILSNLAENGDLGVKSGKGFYDWSKRDIDEVIKRRDSFLLQLLKSGQEPSAD
jgi:3-hydroxybutyryl-CoA dehydrogenase